MENLNEGKKSNYMAELAEIDRQSAIVALEAKINKLAEMAEAKTNRLSMVNEDENLSELISKQAVKEMQKSIKEIEKLKEKLLKEFTKKGGKMTEVIDETEVVAEEEVEEGYSTNYEEDDQNSSMEEEVVAEEEIDEAHCTSEEDDTNPTNEEEVNEEFLRMQKLSGILSEEEYKRKLNELFGFGKKKKMVWYLLNKHPRKDNSYMGTFIKQLKGPKDGSDKKGADAALKKHVGTTGESAIAVLAKPGFKGFEGDKSWDSISKMDGVEDVLVQTN